MESYYSDRGEEWNETKIRSHFLSKEGVVFRRDNSIVAFSFYEKKESQIHIHTLQVAPKYQNKTLGGRFFNWYRKLAETIEASEITCSVFERNPARSMYQKIGFNELGIVNGVVRLALPLTSL
jgi:predicted GNAT family acetyltransferase